MLEQHVVRNRLFWNPTSGKLDSFSDCCHLSSLRRGGGMPQTDKVKLSMAWSKCRAPNLTSSDFKAWMGKLRYKPAPSVSGLAWIQNHGIWFPSSVSDTAEISQNGRFCLLSLNLQRISVGFTASSYFRILCTWWAASETDMGIAPKFLFAITCKLVTSSREFALKHADGCGHSEEQ